MMAVANARMGASLPVSSAGGNLLPYIPRKGDNVATAIADIALDRRAGRGKITQNRGGVASGRLPAIVSRGRTCMTDRFAGTARGRPMRAPMPVSFRLL